jgi:catalase
MPRRPRAPKSEPGAAATTPTPKDEQLAAFSVDGLGERLTTNHGVAVNDDQNTVKAGDRGPSLLEDFHFREKITHFDHERIPERVVHARGTGAHGFFQVYDPLAEYTKAGFLIDPARRTPVFVRFSTVVGSRGSTDLPRDVRGFAVKFYTDEGNFDLVGNNMPVFFIQDAIKFPDLIHAVKPEPHNEIPQAASAHTTFWDFISLMPESAHMIMWLMSDRAIPRSYRMMEGFGVHTFRLVNAEGRSRFVKFHWKPLLGVHSVVWDEAQKISGKDPDFHRRDLWEAIETGNFPEWELGLQIVEPENEHDFDFDLLDATKIIPEELVPVRRVGKLTLNRNPDNFFAETEQVAFHIGNVVPGIDFTNDPLLQGRLFSYTDTQLIRLGGPNFHEIPINRPVARLRNNQRDGFMRQTIDRGRVSYEPNSLLANSPVQVPEVDGGFVPFPEPIDAEKTRRRAEKFFDHFSQATMFYQSQSEPEQDHMVRAFCFELGKVDVPSIRERMVGILTRVDETLAARVAKGLGIALPVEVEGPLNRSIPADGDPAGYEPRAPGPVVLSEALSMVKMLTPSAATRKVAILAADGVDGKVIRAVQSALAAAMAMGKVVGAHDGALEAADGSAIPVDYGLLTVSSVLFDAVFVPGGEASIAALAADVNALEFVADAYKHCKTVGATGAGTEFVQAALTAASPTPPPGSAPAPDEGVVTGEDRAAAATAKAFVASLANHRHWRRETILQPML